MSNLKYLLFEKSAIEKLVSKTGFQSTEFPLGMDLVNTVCSRIFPDALDTVCIKYDDGKGIFFVGKQCTKTFLLFDLTQCMLLEEQSSPENMLLILQKVFRTSIRIWNHQPFTSSERMKGSKSIIFPFVYSDHRRIVIERAAKCERLEKRGIDRPLLAYKYNAEDAPKREEIPDISVLRDSGETYLSRLSEFVNYFSAKKEIPEKKDMSTVPLLHENINEHVADGGFSYLKYEQQFDMLTTRQKEVVENINITSPIRIDGPAGTGKTASMILRAYRLLLDAYEQDKIFNIIFFAHSETTRAEISSAFELLENSDYFLSGKNQQSIAFTTLLDYCIDIARINYSQLIERDAGEAKQSQRILIEDALDAVCDTKYKSYKPLLSPEINTLFNFERSPKRLLLDMLQHEFSIQIKGRTNCTIEEYNKVERIKNALPVKTEKDKEFIFSIFLAYQNMLKVSSVYDSDDITIQALSQLNAPIWRRERCDSGFDYIFVDEMHLFNINEQHTFHYLTKSAEQKEIPICFALDYSQAIGDRGDTESDYIETAFGEVERNKYKTVFRSSQQITDFCAAISASGALMFQNSYIDPYSCSASGFTHQEEQWSKEPQLFMYPNEDQMFLSLKSHIDLCIQETHCKANDIAIISFEDSLMEPENVSALSAQLGKNIFVLKDRHTSIADKDNRRQDGIILSDPNNINGLEFKCVILYGVDEGRVPQSVGVNDVSLNYIKYIAFNQLYLSSSRAKYQLKILGNDLHGISTCLQYAIESNKLLQVFSNTQG